MPRRCSNWRSRKGAVKTVTADLDRFQAMLDESDDLKRFVSSPVFSAEDQLKANCRSARRPASAAFRKLFEGRGA
jgi:F0F1-type ATP synthase delta subunit